MNKWNIGKLAVTAVATVLGSVLWTGCASTHEAGQPTLETTWDPHQAGPNTYPQYNHDMIFNYPPQSGYVVESVE
jgi:hypothetical protein